MSGFDEYNYFCNMLLFENNKSLAKLIDIEIIIINFNTCLLTVNCIESILQNGIEQSRIIVVDNNSSDNSVEYIRVNYPGVRIIQNEKNYGYAKAINIGVGHSNARYLIISNSDVIYPENSIETFINEYLEINDAGIATPLLMNLDGTYQLSYSYFPGVKFGLMEIIGLHWLIHKIRKRQFNKGMKGSKSLSVEYCAGAVMLFSRQLFSKLGGFSEDFFFYTEETDFCKRAIDFGYTNYIIQKSSVYHLNGGTRGELKTPHIRLLVFTKRLYLKKHCTSLEMEFYRLTQLFKFANLFLLSKIGGFFIKSISYKIIISKDFFRAWFENYSVLEKEVKSKYGT